MTCIICITGRFEMRGANLPPKESYLSYLRHESVKLSTTSAVVHAVIMSEMILPYLEELFTLPRYKHASALISRIGKYKRSAAI